MHIGRSKPFLFILVLSVFALHCSGNLPIRKDPPAQWESIFFRLIDKTTHLADMRPLREIPLAENEIEIRFWRGFGLQNFEGLILKRSGNGSAAKHLIADDYVEPHAVQVRLLDPPNGGWEALWNELDRRGFTNFPDEPGDECRGGLDGTGYVVEINQRGLYRTFRYPSDTPKCKNSLEMDWISEFIGMEFHDGRSSCLEAEWLPCAEILRNRNKH